MESQNITVEALTGALNRISAELANAKIKAKKDGDELYLFISGRKPAGVVQAIRREALIAKVKHQTDRIGVLDVLAARLARECQAPGNEGL